MNNAQSTPPQGGLFLCAGLILYACILFILAGGFFFREWWATDLWPFSYTSRMSHALIASILAAAGASILWCAAARDLRAMVGVGIDAFVITAPAAIYALTLSRTSLRGFAIAAAITALAGVVAAIWCHRYRFRDERPTPKVVRWSFATFVLTLWIFGGLMAMGRSWVLPWEASRETTILYGWMFLGASSYFLYGLIIPKWSNAVGQLLAFLAYDLVLIVPFVVFFRHVPQERLVNHVVYTLVIVYSGLLAVVYCFVNPTTRVVSLRLFRR